MKINSLVLRDFLVALFVFLPSLATIPLILHLLMLPFLGLGRFKLSKSLFLLLAIIVLSAINQLINIDIFLAEAKPLKELIPFSLFMLVSYYFATKVNQRILKFVVLFIIIEILIGVLEYLYGVRSFIPSVREAVSGENPFGYKGLLYYSRVSGLSTNSSAFAMKIFAGILVVHFIEFKRNKTRILAYVLLSIGLLLTFTRSVYVALAVFLLLVNYSLIKRIVFKFFMGKTRIFYIVLTVFACMGLLAVFSKMEVLISQLNRGMVSADLSSRNIVFQRFYEFLSDHFWLGNGSYKLWILINDKLFHAHNVYLQILSTNGVLIGLFYFLFVLLNINKLNFKYVIPILVLSVLQYAVFWGISFLDLIFFTFLLIKLNNPIYILKKKPSQNE